MVKPSPNPLDSHRLPSFDTRAGNIFAVVDGIDIERVLANLCETLASTNAMVSDLAFELEGSRRHFVLAIQQMVELGELLANRALDSPVPSDPVGYQVTS